MVSDNFDRDVFDLVPPDHDQLQLERLWLLPENPTEVDRLRAMVPANDAHAEAIQQRIKLLEHKQPLEARDRLGALIMPGARVVYSRHCRYDLSLGAGTVVGVEPVARRFWTGRRTVQVHIRTDHGTHVRIVDPQRVAVLGERAGR